MSARLRITDMPAWPRFLSREEAAGYVGVSEPIFDAEVAEGKWPAGMRRGRKGGRITWDRVAIDRAADRQSGLLGAGPDEIAEELSSWQPSK
jgi:hypothetical protein